MGRARYTDLFLTEGREHLVACAQLLVELEQAPRDLDPVHGLFRAIHTLKGMAATMGYSQVTDLSHQMETVLDAVRLGERRVNRPLIDVLLETVDALTAGIEWAAQGRDAELDFQDLLARLNKRPRTRKRASNDASAPKNTPLPNGMWIEVVIDPAAPMRGGRAAVLLREAGALGAVSEVTPSASELERESFTGRLGFHLASDAAPAAIAARLRTVGDVLEVTCEPRSPGREAPGAGERNAADPSIPTVRVDRRRLDALMNQVGELVVTKNRLASLAAAGGGELAAAVDKMARLVSEMQAEVMLARLTPVAEVFDRFPRMVRDLSRVVDKEVSLNVEGRHIEVDRSILEQIGEPLLHLLRNAIDHGIESAGARKKAGKPRAGQLSLIAARERNSVTFEVRDDGAGIDRAAILTKAKQEGSVADSVTSLTDEQLLEVLGRPGFSTAKRVTSVSGRGVGVDVVLTRIRPLGGSVEIRSEVGRGTSVTLRLPLTVVLLRALVARVGEERYVIPVTHVAETVFLDSRSATTLDGRHALNLRDEAIPTVRLRDLAGFPDEPSPTRQPCVVFEVGTRRTALVVDALLGQEEIVVEPFQPPSGTPAVFAGATILADGSPSLILDAAAVV
jgi:two-component system chemotaxis sensor kinase CheA